MFVFCCNINNSLLHYLQQFSAWFQGIPGRNERVSESKEDTVKNGKMAVGFREQNGFFPVRAK